MPGKIWQLRKNDLAIPFAGGGNTYFAVIPLLSRASFIEGSFPTIINFGTIINFYSCSEFIAHCARDHCYCRLATNLHPDQSYSKFDQRLNRTNSMRFEKIVIKCSPFNYYASIVYVLYVPLSKRGRAQRLINLEIPAFVQSLKSSNVELG